MAQNNDINIKINVNSSQAEKNTSNYKKRVRELTDEMTNLQLAGKENTAQYAEAAKELANIKDAMGDTAAVARTLSDDFFKQRAAMEGLALGANVFSQLTQAAELCGIENENLSKALNRLQAVMNLANTAMNISKALNKDSALMIALRTKNTKALTGAQKANTVATEAGAVATTGLATAEKTATAAAGQLTIGCKAVGTAIKAIPIIGWIATAVSLLMTLKDLIVGFFDEEERGVEIRKEQIKLLDEYNSRLRKVYTSVNNEAERYEYIVKRLGEIKEGGAEWEDLMHEVATATGITFDYFNEHPKIIKGVLNAQHQLNKATQQYNAYQELIQDAAEEYIKTRGWWSEKDEDEKEAMRIKNYILEDQINSWKQLAKAEEMSMKAASQTMYMYKDISKTWKKVADEKAKALEDAEKARLKRIEETRKELEELNDVLYPKGEEEQITDKYDRLLDLAIKHYGEESQQVEEITRLRMDALDQLAMARQKANEQALQENEEARRLEEEARRLEEEATLEALKKAEKIRLEIIRDGTAEGSAERLKAQLELNMQLANMEISEAEREIQNTELLEQTKAQIIQKYALENAKVQSEYNLAVLEDYSSKIDSMGSIAIQFSNLVTSLQDAELEAAGDNERKQRAIKQKYAKMNFASQIAAIGIDTAKGIMSVWSTAGEAGPILGPILGAIQTALIIGTGIAQTAKAKTAMNKALSGKAARGAWVTGKSHAEGGELYELERGEAVLNKRAMAVPAFRNLASAMNQATGGVAFPTNSMTTSLPAISATVSEATIAKIVAGVAAIPVVVTESSITNAQRNVSVIEKRSTF